MRKQTLLAVAAVLDNEMLAIEHGIGFNMLDFITCNTTDWTGHGCNTTACIAGYAAIMFNLDGSPQKRINGEKTEFGMFSHARHVFNISELDAEALFYGRGLPESRSLSSVLPKEAARVIRKFVETDEVDWSIISPAVPANK